MRASRRARAHRMGTRDMETGHLGTGRGDTGHASPGRASWVPLLAVSLGYFMVILDATAVNIALPALRQDLGGGITGLQWVVGGYTLAFAALLLSSGVAGDRFGPRQVFLTGLVLFTVASAGCALTPAIGVLVLIRLIQGAAAALLVPSSLALLQASYPGQAGPRRGRVGRGAGGLAAASGPVLGGALTTAASWRLVFAINIPVSLLAWWLTRRRIASPMGQRDRRGESAGPSASPWPARWSAARWGSCPGCTWHWPCAAARSCSGRDHRGHRGPGPGAPSTTSGSTTRACGCPRSAPPCRPPWPSSPRT